MVAVWTSVIKTLIDFVIEEVSGFFSRSTPAEVPVVVTIAPPMSKSLLAPVKTPTLLANATKLQLAMPTPVGNFIAPTVMYVAVDKADCLAQPHVDFDGRITIFSYGSAVTVISYAGRYAEIQRQNITGWILKDELVTEKQMIWPNLSELISYDYQQANTKKIRLIIEDEFLGDELNLPLQPSEYITYRLKLDGRAIPWPNTRPRSPGQWQSILRGLRGVHLGVAPKTDSVMEWYSESGEGMLAYVESVTPAETIIISLVGAPTAGIFSRQELTAASWREWRPVFIEVI